MRPSSLLLALAPLSCLLRGAAALPTSTNPNAALASAQEAQRAPEEGDERNKYFHEPGYDSLIRHYDSNHFHGVVSNDTREDTLKHMIRAYLTIFHEKRIETWIAHGTLLGWWWNGKMLPW